MTLPTKIEPCPIVDALVEIRFASVVPPNAVFGIIYNKLKEKYSNYEGLPIMQLPEAIRNSDPGMKYKPYYKLSTKDFVVQIGPEVVTVSSFPKYVGWELFSREIFDVLERIEELGIIERVVRVGLRYINFFENDLYDKINLNVSLSQKEIDYRNTVIRTDIKQDAYVSTLQVANNREIQHKDGAIVRGSIVDIDTILYDGLDDFFLNKKEIIGNAHLKEKELFFGLLKDEFIQEFKIQN